MKLELKRVILFTSKMKEARAFYRDQLGLPERQDAEFDASEWIEFDAGPVRIALHRAYGNGSGAKSKTCAHKVVFYAKDVAKARLALLKKKVKMGDVKKFGDLVLCDGVDPDGNKIQISNRP
jgi:catechol 2,3-dioxygenase-like lactoylglutathione lyase family enzyme